MCEVPHSAPGGRQRPVQYSIMSRLSLFWIIIFFHALVWVLLPTLLAPAYKPDVIELMLIGREWVWASAKHPMLPAWLLEITNILTGRCFAAPFIISQLCVVGTLTAVWAFARSVLPAPLAIVPPLTMLPYWFFTVESTKFNQNIALVLLWTWSIFFVFKALQTNRLRYWSLTGLALGVGFHAKFTMIFLVVAVLAFMSMDKRSRRYWTTPGPYLTTLLALLVFSPQVVWLLTHEAPGTQTALLTYDAGLLNRLWFPLLFFVEVVGFLLIPSLMLAPLFVFPWARVDDQERNENDQWTVRFLATVIGIPFLAHLFIAAALPQSLNPDYGLVFGPLFAVLLLLRYKTKDCPDFRRFGILVGLGELVMIGAFIVQAVWSPYLTGTPRGFHFPMRTLGAVCDRIWAEQVGGPCPYVSGVWWFAGNAAQTMKPTPRVHAFGGTYSMDENLPLSTWSTDADINRSGGLILWNADDGTPKTLFKRFPDAEILPSFELNYQTSAKIPPLHVGVAVVRPMAENTGSPDNPPTEFLRK